MDDIENFVELDRLNMAAVIDAAGGTFDPVLRRRKIGTEREEGAVFLSACRAGKIVAYLEYMPEGGLEWKVMSIQIHPDYQHGPVLRDLLAQFHQQLLSNAPQSIRSSVHDTNTQSLSLHRKLGFVKTREDGNRVLFEIAGNVLCRRLARYTK